MSVIILSSSENFHANEVENSLKQKTSILRIDSDSFATPSFYSLNDRQLIVNSEEISFLEVSGIFFHHPLIALPNISTSEIDLKLWLSGWKNFINWMEYSFSEAKWVNKPSACTLSTSIKLQHNLAKRIGFNIPESIFTNSFVFLEQFSKRHKKIVLKTGNVLGGNLTGYKILTQIISTNGINSNILKRSPCLFQNYIEKKFELRVNVIENTVLTCQILSQESEKTEVDWRNYDFQNVPHYPYNLDDKTKSMCVALTKEMNLCYSAIDLIVGVDEKIYFLECNSQAHWLWIEKLTGLPITKEIVNALI